MQEKLPSRDSYQQRTGDGKCFGRYPLGLKDRFYFPVCSFGVLSGLAEVFR